MGNQLLDQYSLLHFASGIVAYYWGVPLDKWFLAHVTFEIVENTNAGMDFINTNLNSWWPGGKPRADDLINVVGDNLSAVVGWWSALELDRMGKEKGWYK